ncbi:MAG TPA: SDR family oxidoreductase [Baekduia sp.]|jgi:NAD(P)H dehydrogenase (quinone)
MVIGISGASGKLGRLSVEAALERVEPQELVITTRTPANLAEYAERGVDVRHADFDEPESLTSAFAGIERMFMISASNGTGHRYDEHSAAINAAKEAGIQRLVFPSMPKVDDPAHPVGLAAQEYRDAEELLAAGGVPYAILRDAPYSELHIVERFTPALAAGQMRINTADGTAAFVSRQDVARAAIALVLGDGHMGNTYDITGPELLTFKQVAELLAEVSGRPLEYVEIDDATFAKETAAAGVPQLMVEALTGMGKAVREDYFAVQSDDFKQITGHDPLSLRAVLEAHRDELAAAALTT